MSLSLLPFPRYSRILAEIATPPCIWRPRWGWHLQIYTTTLGDEKLEWWAHQTIRPWKNFDYTFSRFDTIQYTRVTDGPTDGQTDGIGVAYTALSYAGTQALLFYWCCWFLFLSFSASSPRSLGRSSLNFDNVRRWLQFIKNGGPLPKIFGDPKTSKSGTNLGQLRTLIANDANISRKKQWRYRQTENDLQTAVSPAHAYKI